VDDLKKRPFPEVAGKRNIGKGRREKNEEEK